MANRNPLSAIGERVKCWWITPAPGLALPPNYRPSASAGGCGCGGGCGDGSEEVAPVSDALIDGEPQGESFDDYAPEQLSSYPDADYQQPGAYVDAYRVLNPNPVAVGQNPGIQLALQYNQRKQMSIVNVSTDIVYIGFGFTPTSTNYTYALPACAASNDGSGGTLIDTSWKGPVYASSAAGAGAVNYTDIPEDSITLTRRAR